MKTNSQSLSYKAKIGAGWSFLGNTFSQGATFLVGLILARIITPEDFGLIGIATAIVFIITGVVDFGFSASLIQKQNSDSLDFNSVFFFNVTISIILYIILYSVSPTISLLFDNCELILVFRSLGILLIINSFTLVPSTILSRNLNFKAKSLAAIFSSSISCVIGVVFALLGFGVWALVSQLISKQLFESILIWHLNKWRPSLKFSWYRLKLLWNFGCKVYASSFLDGITAKLADFFIGMYCTPHALGQFSRSKQFPSVFSNCFSTVIRQVFFSTLCMIQNDTDRLKLAYRRILKISMFASFVFLFVLGSISQSFIYCVLGPQWHDASKYMTLLCLSFSLYPLQLLNLMVLNVRGRSDLFLKAEVIKKGLFVFEIVIGVVWGLFPMLVADVLLSIIYIFVNSHWTDRLLRYSIWQQLYDITPSFIIAASVSIPVYFLKLLTISNWILLSLQLFIAFCFFLLLCNLFNLYEYRETLSIIRFYLKKLYYDI